MHLTAALDELTEAELLDHAEEVSRMQRECEAQVLRIAFQHAVLNNPETLDPEISRLPGRERARRFGGVGTPDVAEFAAASLGARLGISTGSAHSLMADALDLVLRLPQLWRRVEALEVKASYARFVARRTRDLTVDRASYVDERAAESADGRIPWSRFEDLVTGLVVASDPEEAARNEQDNAERQVARPTRSTEDGMRGFFVRAPFPVIALVSPRLARMSAIHWTRASKATSKATDRSPRHGSVSTSGRQPTSRSFPCSTWPTRPPSTPTRSPTDIGRPRSS